MSDRLKPNDRQQILATYLKLHERKLGQHWLWAAIERIANCGESEKVVMRDFGYVTQAPQGWQPIETMPMDGTRVLGWIPWRDGPQWQTGKVVDDEFLPDNRDYPSDMPTFWMPLPQPPKD